MWLKNWQALAKAAFGRFGDSWSDGRYLLDWRDLLSLNDTPPLPFPPDGHLQRHARVSVVGGHKVYKVQWVARGPQSLGGGADTFWIDAKTFRLVKVRKYPPGGRNLVFRDETVNAGVPLSVFAAPTTAQ